MFPHKETSQAIAEKQPPEVLWEKGFLRNFTKFTGKHLCQNLFFNKVADLRLFSRKSEWVNLYESYNCVINLALLLLKFNKTTIK